MEELYLKNLEHLNILNLAEKTIELEKNEYLFREGELGTTTYVILSGKVQISKLNFEGSEFAFRICTKDEVCGELILFDACPRYFFNARALEKSRVAAIPKAIFENEILNSREHSKEFMMWLYKHIQRTMARFCGLITCGKKGTLYSTLIGMANSFGVENSDGSILIDHPMTNQELASFCTSTRETVNIFLNELKKENIISISKGRITIKDIGHLRKYMGCDSCVAVYCGIS